MDAMWEWANSLTWVQWVVLQGQWLWGFVPVWLLWVLVVLVALRLLSRVLRSDYFQSRLPWRFILWLEISSDNLRSGHLKRVLLRQRWLFVLGAAAVSALFLEWIVSWLTQGASLRETLAKALFPDSANDLGGTATASTGAWSVLSAVLIAPLAFVLWWFRDTNQLWLIENNRKDTNLKDFQKLSEWATGLHLVEDEVSTKTTVPADKGQENSDGNPANGAQAASAAQANIETTVKHSQPVAGTGVPPSRREGSEALQVAAVHQLKGYLVGEFGQQFERPTVVLLLALWQRLTQDLSEPPTDLAQKKGRDLRMAYEEWRRTVLEDHLAASPLAKAVQLTLLADKGLVALRKHAPMLPSAWLFGMNSRLPGLEGLRLNHLNLSGLDLRLAHLKKAKFQGVDLSQAQLQGADLSEAQLQGANLIEAQLQGADLRWAQLQGAKLGWAQLQGADLSEAQLQGADLRRAQLQGADLSQAQLQGAKLGGAQLQNARLVNPHADEKTSFHNSETDEHTLVLVKKPIYSLDTTPLPTHALRLKLRNVNGLILHNTAYEEFKPQWEAMSEADQKRIYDKAYHYAADPEVFEKDFPHL